MFRGFQKSTEICRYLFVMGLRNIGADAFKYACCRFKFFVQVVYMWNPRKLIINCHT